MTKTLVEHINLFRSFQEAHNQINTFNYGDEWELTNSMKGDSGTKLEYPIMFCVIDSTSIVSNRPNEGAGELTRNYIFIFADLVSKAEKNELEVLNDQEQTAQDFINWLAKSDIGQQMVIRNNTLTDFTERFEDWIAGWTVTVSIRQPYVYDKCSIPFTLSPPTVPLECPQVTIFESDGITVNSLVNAGGTFTIPSAGCSGTIDVYINGVLTQSIATANFSTETVNIYP